MNFFLFTSATGVDRTVASLELLALHLTDTVLIIVTALGCYVHYVHTMHMHDKLMEEWSGRDGH